MRLNRPIRELTVMSDISEMILALKNSASVQKLPSQVVPILIAIDDAITKLQERVAKLEKNILTEPNVLSDSNVLK
jgi:hypothetical protein